MPKWFSQLSPDRREKYADKLKDRATLNDLADSYVESRTKMERSVTIPTKDSPPEEIKAFYSKLGIPDDEKGYDFEVDKSVPDGDKLAEIYRKNALESGLSKAQAKKGWDFLQGIIKEGSKEQERQTEQTKQTFDARLMKALEPLHPDEAGRKDAANETVNLFKKHIARIGGNIGKIYAEKGLVFDPNFVLAVANDEKSRANHQFIDGKVAPRSGEKAGKMGSYHPDFAKAYGRQ
jgi:hypothetical protein